MGVTQVKLTIKNPMMPQKQFVGDFLVDSGAIYTVIPSLMVKRLGLKPNYEQEFSLADRTTIKRKVGQALVKLEDREMVVPVILGEKKDDALLGLTTLENMGFVLNPLERKIYHARLLPL